MRIAVATDNDMVSAHFGHCEGFTVYETQDKKIGEKEFLQSPGHKPGALPKFLSEAKVDVIIAGGMGETAQTLFNENGIEVVVGVTGSSEDVTKGFLSGEIKSTGSICKDHAHQGEGFGSGDCDEH